MLLKKEINVRKFIGMWQSLALVFMILSLFGCSTLRPDKLYLHNPVNKKLAEEAKSNWTPIKADLWQDLLNNQKLTSEAQLHAQRDLQNSVIKTLHTKNINSSWNDLLTNAKKYQVELTTAIENIEKGKKDSLDTKTETGEKIALLIKEKENRESAVKEVEKNKLAWEAELILFEKAIQAYILKQATTNNSDIVKPKSTKEIFDEILNEKIAVTNEKDGVPLRNALPEEKLKLINALTNKNSIDLSSLQELLKVDEKLFQNMTPPGITFQILTLGANLAKLKIDREKTALNRLNEEITLFSKNLKMKQNALKYIDTAIISIEVQNFKVERNNTVIESIQKSLKSLQTLKNSKNPKSQKNESVLNPEKIILILQSYTLGEDLHFISENQFNISKEALLHYYSIEDAAISAREQEAFIQDVLEALVIYYAGGVTQEEINTIFQATQAVALAVIAGGLY